MQPEMKQQIRPVFDQVFRQVGTIRTTLAYDHTQEHEFQVLPTRYPERPHYIEDDPMDDDM